MFIEWLALGIILGGVIDYFFIHSLLKIDIFSTAGIICSIFSWLATTLLWESFINKSAFKFKGLQILGFYITVSITALITYKSLLAFFG